jgi:hypothetical protein
MLYPLSYGGATSVSTLRPLNTFANAATIFKPPGAVAECISFAATPP